jgi:hypothetical protein
MSAGDWRRDNEVPSPSLPQPFRQAS